MVKILKQFVHTIMLSWRLWQHLLHPSEHPTFRRVLKISRKRRMPLIIHLLIILATMGLCYLVASFLFHVGVPFTVIMPTIMLLISCAYTGLWVNAISMNLTREQQHATYAVICTSPPGAIGVNWAIAAAVLHYGDWLNWVDLARKLVSGVFLLGFCMASVIIIFGAGVARPEQTLFMLLEMLSLVVMPYLEHGQSIVLGVLIAMLTPLTIRTNADTPIWTVFIFITIQALTIIAFIVIAVFIQQAISVSLVLFYGIREALIAVLWRVLVYQLNADHDMLRPAEV